MRRSGPSGTSGEGLENVGKGPGSDNNGEKVPEHIIVMFEDESWCRY